MEEPEEPKPDEQESILEDLEKHLKEEEEDEDENQDKVEELDNKPLIGDISIPEHKEEKVRASIAGVKNMFLKKVEI